MFKGFIRNNVKRFISLMLVLFMLSSFMVSVSAGEKLTLNYTDVKLYVMNDAMKEIVGELPEGYSSTIQLESNTDGVRWYVSSGDTVTVDSNGFVTPTTETWYYYGNMGTTFPPQEGQEPDYVEVRYKIGKSTVTCVKNGERVDISVEVCDYSDVYVDNKIKAYIDGNVTDTMTDYEKLEKVCEYAASFEYSPYASGYESMIIEGGGDCWASASLIAHICNNYLSIEATIRYGVNDPGAASNHKNAVVYIDGKYYAAEAGYYMPAPRLWHIDELDGGYSFHYKNGSYSVYQYDGRDKDIVIPDLYDEKPVTEIEGNILYYNNWAGFKPESVTIPASITKIDNFAFSSIDSIENLYVDEDNEVYCSVDGVIYTEDKSELFACPAGKEGVFNVPEGTQHIGDYAVAYNYKITEVNLPEGVKSIGEGAFGDCSNLTTVSLPESLETISDFAFYNNYQLKELYIPASVTQISDYAFSSTDGVTIYGEEGSYAQDYALSKNIKFVVMTAGDTEQDGEVNIKDATAIQKYLAMLIEFSGIQEKVADFDDNGSVNISDATAIQKMLAGLEY